MHVLVGIHAKLEYSFFIIVASLSLVVIIYIDLRHSKDQLLGILSVLLNRNLVPAPYTIHRSLKSFTFTLCRLSIWHGLVITPPVLKGEGVISYKILDEALMESEVGIDILTLVFLFMHHYIT